jgi:hypothetical protein
VKSAVVPKERRRMANRIPYNLIYLKYSFKEITAPVRIHKRKGHPMQILVSIFILMLSIGLCSAETINLNDGTSITGTILERTDDSVKIESDGIAATYYADEIKDIDGDPARKMLRLKPSLKKK